MDELIGRLAVKAGIDDAGLKNHRHHSHFFATRPSEFELIDQIPVRKLRSRPQAMAAVSEI
jgi:hypothetical protein